MWFLLLKDSKYESHRAVMHTIFHVMAFSFCFLRAFDCAASSQTVLPSQNYHKGVYAFPNVPLNADAQTVVVSVKRDNWPDTGQDVISVRFEFSKDNGRTWVFLFGFQTQGGQIRNPKTGMVQDASWVEFSLPEYGQSHRQIRGAVETYVSLTTSLSIDIK